MKAAFCCFVLLAGRTEAQGQSQLSREMLAAHNRVRARVGVPRLAWSGELARYAQEWAERLLARREFGHRPVTPMGGEPVFDLRGRGFSGNGGAGVGGGGEGL